MVPAPTSPPRRPTPIAILTFIRVARRRSGAASRSPRAAPASGAWRAAIVAAAAALAGCTTVESLDGGPGSSPAQTHALITRLLPPGTPDRVGWATDIQGAFSGLGLRPTPDNLCAAIAVTEQESGFKADPAVPGLAKIAWKEIDDRARRLRIPPILVRTALKVSSPDGQSYSDRIDKARTERELSEVFDDLIGLVPMGKSLFGGWNPVRTGGPMQVAIAFAQEHARARDYPYPVQKSIRDEVFSRRGGMYFGIAHLLDYPASYDRHLYRFADFNAGHYASRNAAFQNAVAIVTGRSLVLDGDLVDFSAAGAEAPGSTERAVRSIRSRLKMSDAQIRSDLEAGKSEQFDRSPLYRRVFALADDQAKAPVPRAVVPRITLKSPKITRNLTTAWFAERVEQRYQRCVGRSGAKASAAARLSSGLPLSRAPSPAAS